MTFSLSLYLDESSPSDPSIRCKVYEAVIRRKSHSDLKKPSSHAQPDEEDIVSENDRSSERPLRNGKQKRGRSRIVILGPLSPQRLEISSESSPSTSSTPPTSRLTRSASTSHIASPIKAEEGDQTHTSCSSPVLGTIKGSDKIDWIEYSRPLSDLDAVDGAFTERSGWSRSDSSWNAPAENDVPVVIINDTPPLPRCTIDHTVLAKLLQDALGPDDQTVVRPPYNPKAVPFNPTARAAYRPPYRLKTPPPIRPQKPKVHPHTPPPQTPLHRRVGLYKPILPRTPPSPLTQMKLRGATLPLVRTPNRAKAVHRAPSESDDTGSEVSGFGTGCAGCGRKKNVNKWMAIEPCGHVLCSTCFSATISSVTTSHGSSRCTACQVECVSFNVRAGPPSVQEPIKRQITTIPEDEVFPSRLEGQSDDEMGGTVVLRIDNVAWDITPDIVEEFLPANALPKAHLHPIHILLDRFDGRTKDYMYVEVSDMAVARKFLKHKQNAMMPGGLLQEGRRRPVTITVVSHQELAAELRPQSQHELFSLLALCQAAVVSPLLTDPSARHSTSHVAPSGLAHFVKSRHGPFYAVMSILTKLRGSESPAYWDLFTVASGAISALANASRSPRKPDSASRSQPTDSEVLIKLRKLFNKCFGAVPETT